MLKKIISIIILSFLFINFSYAAGCKWGRSYSDVYIKKVQYNGEYYPYVTLSDGKEYTLLYNYGVDKDYGKAMLTLALTAVTSLSKVDVCINGGDLTSITIKNDK
ncbi:hypothetical protein [Xenorhabdus budapestensis]|uniref:Uncharacterized protein n=1 Tax=Xenorhabdus budapestensis TaxID=290110 RepID=A0A2D0IW43_XENBU|nr:hypothetical protein [Xenorhabdus budapestensis]PHM26094.1 hypothetical protein Xbud_02740 [Xenorhabdus budapestensis]